MVQTCQKSMSLLLGKGGLGSSDLNRRGSTARLLCFPASELSQGEQDHLTETTAQRPTGLNQEQPPKAANEAS